MPGPLICNPATSAAGKFETAETVVLPLVVVPPNTMDPGSLGCTSNGSDVEVVMVWTPLTVAGTERVAVPVEKVTVDSVGIVMVSAVEVEVNAVPALKVVKACPVWKAMDSVATVPEAAADIRMELAGTLVEGVTKVRTRVSPATGTLAAVVAAESVSVPPKAPEAPTAVMVAPAGMPAPVIPMPVTRPAVLGTPVMEVAPLAKEPVTVTVLVPLMARTTTPRGILLPATC